MQIDLDWILSGVQMFGIALVATIALCIAFVLFFAVITPLIRLDADKEQDFHRDARRLAAEKRDRKAMKRLVNLKKAMR